VSTAHVLRPLGGPDRLVLAALGLADVGVGLYLIDAPGTLHTVAGLVALLLAFPAVATAVVGGLPPLADEGVLVNVAVLTFMALEVALVPGSVLARVGLTVLVGAAALATVGLYLRLFGVIRPDEVRGVP
jgi:hypothetical protein